MDIYKEGLQAKITFTTSKGELTIQEMFDYNRVVDLRKKHKDSIETLLRAQYAINKRDNQDEDELSFLDVKVKPTNKLSELKFLILKDIYETKLAAENEVKLRVKKKDHNARIDEKLAALDEKALDGLTREELLAQRM